MFLRQFKNDSRNKKEQGGVAFVAKLSLLFALLTVLQRLLIQAFFSAHDVNAVTAASQFASLPGHFLTALLPFVLIRKECRTITRTLGFIFMTILVAYNGYTFHFEAIIGTFPDINLLSYLNEWEHLRSSIITSGVLYVFIAEILVITGLLFSVRLFILKRQGDLHNTKWLTVFVVITLLAVMIESFKPFLPMRIVDATRVPVVMLFQRGSRLVLPGISPVERIR